MTFQPPTVTATIVVPVINEQDNVLPLLRGLAEAFVESARRCQVLFIDDSVGLRTVETIQAAEEQLADDYPYLSIDWKHRIGEERWGGLSGAVVDGLRAAQSPLVVIMDGDLQHPPEIVPSLLSALEYNNNGIVLASRYCKGGSIRGVRGPLRRLASRGSTLVAKAAFPKALAGLTDPLTGCFAVRRDRLDLDVLNPIGLKIVLELLVRYPHLKRYEVPMQFAPRHAGRSKCGLKWGIDFIRHLVRLRLITRPAGLNHVGNH